MTAAAEMTFVGPSAALRYPILRNRNRVAVDLAFPSLSLNASEIDSSVIRIPGNAAFLCRQVFYSVALTSNPANLGRARITPSSERRQNPQWMNELVPLELFAGANPMTPQILPMPLLIEPGTSVSLEVQNVDTSSHIYDVTLCGEYVYDLSPDEIELFMRYAWFMFYRELTPTTAVPTGFIEVRAQPDADFHLTHISSLNFAPSNDAAVGPVRTLIEAASQVQPFMDQGVSLTCLAGAYYNVTVTPRTSIGPQPLPEPLRVDRNASLYINARQADDATPTAIGLCLAGMKVF